MKYLLFALLLLLSTSSYSQKCVWAAEEPEITPLVIFDHSLNPTPGAIFGTNAHIGLWWRNLGFSGGLADKDGVISAHVRLSVDRITSSVFFTTGTHSYRDFGIRIYYDPIKPGMALGLVSSKTIPLGVSISLRFFPANQ